jgi:formiminotetrahydrofolate cyclodeaminase
MARLGNVNAVTDAAAGVIMAQAAVQVASLNVRINAVSINDRQLASVLQAKVFKMESEVSEIAARTNAIAAERGGF